MAANNNIITRDNYEEYFVLYIDRELAAADRLLVEDFVRQNPDLADELEALQQTVLPPQPLPFFAKEALYKGAQPITIDNYTGYFVRHIDNELNAEEATALELFLQEHPQLQAELDLFAQTKLPATRLVFDDKLSLYRNAAGETLINEQNYTEFFALYTDNELTPVQRKAVEAFVATRPLLQQELAYFAQARLQPNMELVFAHKASLYRHTEQEERRRVVPMWLRFAAAAAILALVTWFAFIGNKGGNATVQDGPVAGKQDQPVKTNTVPVMPLTPAPDNTGIAGNENNNNTATPVQDNPTAPVNNQRGTDKNNGLAVTKDDAIRNNNKAPQSPVITPDNNIPVNNRQDMADNNQRPEEQLPQELKSILPNKNGQDQQGVARIDPPEHQDANNRGATAVVNKATTSMLPTEEAAGSNVAIMNVPADKVAKKGLRGLGRKVSRFFERKVKNLGNGNGPVTVGGFEIAVAN